MKKRCRTNVTTLSIFVSILSMSWRIPTTLSNSLGTQFLSEECSGLSRRQRTVHVTDISLLCDSGSNSAYSYVDRVVCLSGDLAKAAISFDLDSNGRNISNLYVDMEARILGKRFYLYDGTNLCDFDEVSYWGERDDQSTMMDDLYTNANTNPCPIQDGSYSIFISFTVPSTSKDSTLKITPDFRVRFYSDSSKKKKVGCVESGDLAKVAVSQSRHRKGQQFFLLSMLVLCTLLFFCMMSHQRRRRRQERDEVKKHASIMRRFHYIQTTQFGEVQMMTTLPSLHVSYSRGSVDTSRGVRPPPPTIPENHDDSSSSASGHVLDRNRTVSPARSLQS